MPPFVPLILTVVGAYLVGGIPFGYLIGKKNGIDIREHGSGNIGATNVLRTLGKKWGITCFALDFSKGLVPVLVSRIVATTWAAAQGDAPASTETSLMANLPLIVVFATVAGHIWTPFLRFKGGKGVATSAGALMGVAWAPVLIALAVWGISLKLFRMVGLSSVLAALALPLSGIALARGFSPTVVLLCVLGTLTIIRHRANIRRILNGTEPKIGQKKDTDSHEASSTQ